MPRAAVSAWFAAPRMTGDPQLMPLEAPACRFGAAVRVSSPAFAQTAWLSGIRAATERSSERQRTLVLAILATENRPSQLGARFSKNAVGSDEPPLNRPSIQPESRAGLASRTVWLELETGGVLWSRGLRASLPSRFVNLKIPID